MPDSIVEINFCDMPNPVSFRYFKTSPEIIRLAVMPCSGTRFRRGTSSLLHERGIDVSHETVRYWWQRFGPMFASKIRNLRIAGLKFSS